jgi:hypothetical protein
MAEIFKINDVEYEFECKLSNPDGQEVSFTKSAVRGMTLVDNVFDPFTSGTISIANPYDFIEDKYFMRGDGRDKIHIMFKTKDGEEKVENDFIIIDDADNVNPMVRSENIKTFTLIDSEAIPFMDNVPYGKSYSGKVGTIIQEIFIELLGEDLVDKDKWEEGDFIINYIPPTTFRYIDLLRYLMRLYYGKDEEIYVKGFLFREDGKFTLQFISKIFSKNNDNTLEAFPLGDLSDKIDTSNVNNPPSGPEVKEYIGQLRSMSYSTPLYDWTKDYFLNSLIIGYDRIMGQSKIQKLKFDDVKEKWTKKFVDVFKSIDGKPKPFGVVNNTTNTRFKYYKFPYAVEDGVKLVEAEMHNNLTFLNLQLSFSNIGDVKRRSNRFIDIFSTRGNTELKSDEKILGRWYVTEVRHNFFADLYSNQIFACKTYIGPRSNVKEDVE